jgi:putative transposase
MVRIDAIYREDDPTSDSHRIVLYLAREERRINREHVNNLMRRMGLRKIYKKPRRSIPGTLLNAFPA